MTVSVAPATTTLAALSTVQFASTVTGASNTAVTWSVQEGSAGGSVSPSGLYTAPASPGTFHVVATSQADAAKSGLATVTVTPPAAPAVTLTPSAASIGVGATVQFTATVTGTANTAVGWSVQEGSAGGTVSPTGLYTAPLVAGTFHVVATSAADPTRTGTATVAVAPAACALPAPQASALPASQVLELGIHTVGETVTFQVPASTGSVTLLQQGADPAAARTITFRGAVLDNTVVPLTVSVGGTVFFDDNTVPPADPASWGTQNGIGAVYFFSESPWTGTMTVPNTTNMLDYVTAHGGVPQGTWSVVVNDWVQECKQIGASCVVGDGTTSYPPGRYDVKVLLKQGAVPATGVLDVNFYLVTDTLTAATAATDPSVARMRQTLATVLAGAGLTLGTVGFVDVPPAVKTRFSNGVNVDQSGPCSEVATILQLSTPGNAMNLFLVNQLISAQPGTGVVVGIDGTVPGPSSAGGTVWSGALVSIQDLTGGGSAACQGAVSPTTCGPDATAYIAAHETGHFLGLYHDTESTGTLFDPVKDTPTCLCSACAPASQVANCSAAAVTATTYQVTTIDCTAQLANPSSVCGGGENLMFWLLGSRSTGAVTPQQARIVRANPLVH